MFYCIHGLNIHAVYIVNVRHIYEYIHEHDLDKI